MNKLTKAERKHVSNTLAGIANLPSVEARATCLFIFLFRVVKIHEKYTHSEDRFGNEALHMPEFVNLAGTQSMDEYVCSKAGKKTIKQIAQAIVRNRE